VILRLNEDAKIGREGLQANFQDIIDSARQRLAHRVFQLKESHDFTGYAHKAWVERVEANIKQHLDEAEKFLKEE